MFFNKSLLFTIIIISVAGLIINLGCSAGSLIVQIPTQTPIPKKTIKPTFTFTPYWTPTFTPSVTPTETATPTPSKTPTPTKTATPTEKAVHAQAAAPPPAKPAEPTATSTPEEPTATPTPAYPFSAIYFIHDTGSPGETRMTAWVRVDYAPGIFRTLSNFQMKAVTENGTEYLGEISGSGAGDSTVKGTGDNHNMNTKLEFQPYTPGKYKITLLEGGVQMSQEIEIVLGADPRQYVHFDFFKSEKEK